MSMSSSPPIGSASPNMRSDHAVTSLETGGLAKTTQGTTIHASEPPAPPTPKAVGGHGLPAPEPTPDHDDTSPPGERIGGLATSLSADAATMMRLLHEVSRETRKSATEMRAIERETRIGLLQSGVDDLREAAKWALAAGVVAAAGKVGQGAANMAGGAITMGAGGLGMIGSGLSLTGGIKSLGTTDPTRQQLTQNTWGSAGGLFTQSGKRAEGMAAATSGSGGVISGLADGVAAGLNYVSKQKEADQKAKEAEAERLQAGIERSNDFVQTMRDALRDIQQRLAAMQQSEHETAVNIVRA